MADFGGDTDLEAFRTEAKTWLEANFPAALKGKASLGTAEVRVNDPDLAKWRKAMGEKGWGTPTWPKEYGGGGLSPQQARVLLQEMTKIGAFNPLMFGMGVTMIGPTIMDYGTEAQKQKHLPPIVRGDVQWCVGYSEPNAGSDLASLQTKAVDNGDGWTINGQKTWTSGAQYSDWCGCLVRTDPSAKKHEGISFMLIDMHQKEIETRPIALIAGASPFCETFFTDAKAPKDALLGQLNVGWTVGKRLLQHERASQTGASTGGRPPAPLSDIAKKYVGVDDHGRIADSDLRTRVIKHQMDAKVHGLTLARAVAEAKGNNSPGNAASVLKNSATHVAQTRAELSLEIMGHQGLGWEGGDFKPEELETVRGWLFGKAMSIYGGSSEIQNNIVSKRILSLPDTTQST
ncbi:MAG: acyl-CoA dehydrogenase family protein [Alphaproteobacteria bacterium]|nr:acyl-CoA dehydrogenase family protein [Alphaproteobacteria bacterium]MBU1516006.1 acyl-CoA dehydrogenase family protein [Alphaproteobacteria bacterium]MBU2092779.1 acyl-CoA dehydrogenase family protein [Alphaproteobacteria bacterium]MBU2153696.1 acyl-CoA dehydrogenase family protein [Alphaproteobacteria bacterium]MBU2308324.1 acyl-CoA dehydrogenase family protein [Alphaproteobacteria bacterium]